MTTVCLTFDFDAVSLWVSTFRQTSATPVEVDEAVLLNAAARLRALKATFLFLAAISLLSIIPSLRLPNYRPDELSADELTKDHPSTAPVQRTG